MSITRKKRPVFIVLDKEPYFEQREIEFEFCTLDTFEGKQKNVFELHRAIKEIFPEMKVLEISTKSPDKEGTLLSAFNLKKYVVSEQKQFAVENIYQSSKVFENGKRYKDLLYMTAKQAKKDERLLKSGKVTEYIFEDEDGREKRYSVQPANLFFNYIYMTALKENEELARCLEKYDAFTDIEFDPETGVNCQAKAAAEYEGRRRNGLI